MPALMGNSRDKSGFRREQVVARLFDAWLDDDVDRVRSFFCEDSVYEPFEGEPITGVEALWAMLGSRSAEQIERELLAIASEGEGQVVARQRVRRLINGRWDERELKVLLAVDGCKIRSWRDCAAG